MRVVYAGRDGKKRKALTVEHQDVVVLLQDNWDDHTYKAAL